MGEDGARTARGCSACSSEFRRNCRIRQVEIEDVQSEIQTGLVGGTMTRFLLFLSLVGAAIYTLLIFTHDALTDGKAENIHAGQTQPNQPAPHLSSWDAYLPDRSVSQNPQAATSQPSTSQLPTTLPPRQSDEPSQNSERDADQLAASENKATSSGSDGAEPESVELAKVVLAAQRHRAAKPAVRDRVVVANADPWNGRWSRRADRRRGAGLIMFHPFGRWAQGR
jgi:hypothetical protein